MATRGAQHKGKVWTEEQIEADCTTSADHFRERRGTSDSLDDYLEQFAVAETAARTVITDLSRLVTSPTDKELLIAIVRSKPLYTALRYLTAPPISHDDLGTMLQRKPTVAALTEDEDYADELAAILKMNLDPKRFPWIATNRRPSATELDAAVLATSVAMTSQRVQTKRRGDEKSGLEGSVEDLLLALQFRKLTSPVGADRKLTIKAV